MPFFSNEQVTLHLKRILMPCGVCAYLAQGERRAVLIDTGFGLGDLKSYVDSLVTTPYMVLLSHGHLDHAGGAGQFDMVWLNKADWSLARRHCTIENRLRDIYNGPDGMPAGATEQDLIPPRTEPYYPLSDGDGFPLGSVTVEAVSVPGHTAGMTVFLLPEDRVAIFGDACGEHTLLTKESPAGVSARPGAFIRPCGPVRHGAAQPRRLLLRQTDFSGQPGSDRRNHGRNGRRRPVP